MRRSGLVFFGISLLVSSLALTLWLADPGFTSVQQAIDILKMLTRGDQQAVNLGMDANEDGQVGLGEAIHSLQTEAGLWVDPRPSALVVAVSLAVSGDLIRLDGSYSTDPQGGTLTYSWTQLDGTPVALDGAGSQTASFIAPGTAGDLIFQLTVTTSGGLTRSAQATVTVSTTPVAAPSSSTDLIQAAVEGGTLTTEQGLVYKVLAAFGDIRLPQAYVGDSTVQPAGSSALNEVIGEYDALSPESQATVYPFLLPPYVQNSWYDLRKRQGPISTGRLPQNAPAPGWKSKSGSCVKVWYEEGYQTTQTPPVDFEVIADALVTAAETKILGELKTLMGGRELISDLNFTPPTPPPNLGFVPGDLDQDGRLDIILCRGLKASGYTQPYKKRPSPSFITIDIFSGPIGDDNTPGLVQTLAHEMMHVLQNTYPLKEENSTYLWLQESTAKWAEDHVYEKANSEKPSTKAYFDTMSLSVDKTGRQREYGAYTLFSYFANSECCGGKDIIRQIWEAVGSKSSLDAVDAANPVPSGYMLPHRLTSFWERYWGDFLVKAWNNEGTDGYYFNKDTTTDTPKVRAAVEVKEVSPSETYHLDLLDPDGEINLPYLSARYYYFLFANDTARAVFFYDGLRSTLQEDQEVKKTTTGSTYAYKGIPLPYAYNDPAEGAAWRILVKIGGKWQDWTDTGVKRSSPMLAFCRDAKNERIEAMAVALGNGSPTKENFVKPVSGGLAPLVYVSNVGCWRWEGNVNVDLGGDNEMKVSSKTHLTLKNAISGNPAISFGDFNVLSAVTTTTISGSSTTVDSNSSMSCSYDGSGTIVWGSDPLQSHQFKTIPFATAGELYRKGWFESSGSVMQQVEYTASCTITETLTYIDPDTGEEKTETISRSESSTKKLTPDVWPAGLSVIKPEFSADGAEVKGSFTTPDGDTYEWNLKALTEP